MANSVQQPRDEELETRKTLEHIARAISLRPEGEERSHQEDERAAAPLLDTAGTWALLNALPSALALLSPNALLHANPAFANAFGYRSFAELEEAGGLLAILPSAAGDLEAALAGFGRGLSRLRLDALTRGRRQMKANFELVRLQEETSLFLLRLVDQSSSVSPAAGLSAGASPEAGDRPLGAPATSEQQLNFLAKVSHEVRTPLNSILGFTELMIGEKLGPIGNERYRGYIEDIHQSGLYALSLLNDLLDLSKIEAGKFELDFTAVEVAEIVEECIHIVQPLARRERILLRTSLEPELPCVIADPRRLKQILLNLLSNAVKFTREGGQVIVSGKLFPNGTLRLRVRDNGVGMTADEIQLAMQPFQQLDTSPRNQSGTGLGLPLTKALIEANRARFMLTSESGVGTSADVIFPKERLAEEV